jgi:GntR family transcriptional regulator
MVDVAMIIRLLDRRPFTVYTQYIDMNSSIVISQSDGRPMYLQIMEQIKQKVAVGEWGPGEEIPSIRMMAVALRVSVITVKRAYMELEREGVILTQHGKGSIVAADPGLAPRLYHREFGEHLEQVVRIGTRLGLTTKEMTVRLRDTASRLREAQVGDEDLAKETL